MELSPNGSALSGEVAGATATARARVCTGAFVALKGRGGLAALVEEMLMVPAYWGRDQAAPGSNRTVPGLNLTFNPGTGKPLTVAT